MIFVKYCFNSQTSFRLRTFCFRFDQMAQQFQIILIKADKTNELHNSHKIVPSTWTSLKNGIHQVRYSPPPYKEEDTLAIEEMVMTKMWPIPDEWPQYKCNQVEYSDSYAAAVLKLEDINQKKQEKQMKAKKRKIKEVDKSLNKVQKLDGSCIVADDEVLNFEVSPLDTQTHDELLNLSSKLNSTSNISAAITDEQIQLVEICQEKTCNIDSQKISITNPELSSGHLSNTSNKNNLTTIMQSDHEVQQDSEIIVESDFHEVTQDLFSLNDLKQTIDQGLSKEFEKLKSDIQSSNYVKVSDLSNILTNFLEKAKNELGKPYGVRLNRLEKKVDDLTSFLQASNFIEKENIFTFQDFVAKHKCQFPIKCLESFNLFDKSLSMSSTIYQDLHLHLKTSINVNLDKLLDSLNLLFQTLLTFEVLQNYTTQRVSKGKYLFKKTNFYFCLKDALFKAFNKPGNLILSESYLLSAIGTIISNYAKDWDGGREERRKRKEKEKENEKRLENIQNNHSNFINSDSEGSP